jgi:hypothetical protein
MILRAKESFVEEVAGGRHEVHAGDLISDSHPTAQARPKSFEPASEDDVREANEAARRGA